MEPRALRIRRNRCGALILSRVDRKESEECAIRGPQATTVICRPAGHPTMAFDAACGRRRWVAEATGGGLCDWLGLGPVAKIVYAPPARFREILRWTKSKNPWRRRIAVYALHDFIFAGELDNPFQLLGRLLYDDEFWVQRAVGTWLREAWKRDPRRTEAFLRQHVRGLPKVVITVATERAPNELREDLRRGR